MISFTRKHSFTYDANGVRTSKTITQHGSAVISCKYIYDGNNLIAEQRGTAWIYYIYGADGISGFRYNNETYLYRKNAQGDITHIYTKDGQLVARYAYDAWGNIRILQGENGIATVNPFRYRGYYFDSETNLYYLQTRYYDPEVGRFISSDSIEYLDPETLGGLNLYAYCLNNAIMYTDPEGTNVADDASSVFEWLFFVLQIGASTIKGLSINLGGVGRLVKGVGSNAKAFGNLMGNVGGVISQISTVVGYTFIALSNIIDGVQSGKSALNIVTDTVFDITALSLGTTIGAAIGSVIPVVGTVIGAVIGLVLNYLYLHYSSSIFIQEMKDGFYNGVNIVINGLISLGNAIESAAEGFCNWFKSLFGL